MTTTEQASAAAVKLARRAAQARQGLESCPYPAAATGTTAAARSAWISEYNRLRPIAVDYGDQVTDLAAAPIIDAGGVGSAKAQPNLYAGTTEADQVEQVDDAGDVLLEDGWEPEVPNVLLDLREAHSDRKLRAYWVHGAGSKKVNWGVAGDFKRCVAELAKYVDRPEGLCNSYHHAALGVYPGQEGKK